MFNVFCVFVLLDFPHVEKVLIPNFHSENITSSLMGVKGATIRKMAGKTRTTMNYENGCFAIGGSQREYVDEGVKVVNAIILFCTAVFKLIEYIPHTKQHLEFAKQELDKMMKNEVNASDLNALIENVEGKMAKLNEDYNQLINYNNGLLIDIRDDILPDYFKSVQKEIELCKILHDNINPTYKIVHNHVKLQVAKVDNLSEEVTKLLELVDGNKVPFQNLSNILVSLENIKKSKLQFNEEMEQCQQSIKFCPSAIEYINRKSLEIDRKLDACSNDIKNQQQAVEVIQSYVYLHLRIFVVNLI